MIKKIFTLLLFALCFSVVRAAPYNLDAPIESYTWGESMKTVMESDKEAGWRRVSDIMLMLPEQEGDSAIFLRFWRGKLAAIAKSYSSKNMTAEEKDAKYKRHLADFTARWGKPGPAVPCVGNPVVCSEVIWNASATTQVSLYFSTPEADTPFIGYSFSSRETMPAYQEEIREIGVRHPVAHLIASFSEKPGYAKKTLKGKRVRTGAIVARLAPLTLKHGPYEIKATLRNNQDTASLQPGLAIEISGVVEGVKDNTLQLSDVFVVSPPDVQNLAINRGGRQPMGFFLAEGFYTRLDSAAGQVFRNLSLSGHSSLPRLEGKRIVVDYLPNEIPDSITFSLESLYPDQSSDTIAFNLSFKNKDREQLLYIVAIGTGIIINASLPDEPLKEAYAKIEGILETGGKTVVNGWTYRCKKQDDKNFTFSATAPARKK